jgi:hypothetical protein
MPSTAPADVCFLSIHPGRLGGPARTVTGPQALPHSHRVRRRAWPACHWQCPQTPVWGQGAREPPTVTATVTVRRSRLALPRDLVETVAVCPRARPGLRINFLVMQPGPPVTVLPRILSARRVRHSGPGQGWEGVRGGGGGGGGGGPPPPPAGLQQEGPTNTQFIVYFLRRMRRCVGPSWARIPCLEIFTPAPYSRLIPSLEELRTETAESKNPFEFRALFSLFFGE